MAACGCSVGCQLSSFSRPGSSYTRAETQPPVIKRQGTAKVRDLVSTSDPTRLGS